MMGTTLEQVMQRAIGHHQAGRLTEAEALYRRVLGQAPDHPDALHLLGALAFQTGHNGPAIDLVSRAIALKPGVAEYHGTLAEAYRRAGRPDAAIAHFHHALALKPELALVHGNLGAALQAEGRLDEAIAAFRRSVELDPNDAVVQSNLGAALIASGQLDEAISALSRAVALTPGNVVGLRNLGAALHSAGRLDQAIAVYQHALELRGDDASTYSNLAVSLQETGRLDEAIAAVGQAIALRPGFAEAHVNLGTALWKASRLDEANAALRQAIALKPDHACAYNLLGSVLKDQGRHDEGLACLRKAVTLDPGSAAMASNLLFNLHFDPHHDAPSLLAEHRIWARRYADPLAGAIRPHPNDRTPGRRLRVGYLSPDFRAHGVGQMLLALFAHHDRGQVEVVAYSDVRVPDSHTVRLRALSDEWHDIAGRSDQQLAEQIQVDQIDILIDLAMHLAGNRMLVFARKPAPVQVTMLAPPSTTGLATMDYRVTDPYVDPPGAGDAAYSEQSVRLPHSLWVFQEPEVPAPVGPLPAAQNGFVTFGCLNQFAKVSRPALELWVKVLQELPGARLVIQAEPGTHRAEVRALFQRGGIAAERIRFVPRAGRKAYFERYHGLDLGLDPFPYNGHTSTLDAFWMGVPVVTLAGRTAVGRVGVSNLANVGLPELIARTPEEYVAIAVAWARDRARLGALRAELRQRLLSSPMANCPQYAADVEAAYRWMWERWCRG